MVLLHDPHSLEIQFKAILTFQYFRIHCFINDGKHHSRCTGNKMGERQCVWADVETTAFFN